MGEDMDIIREQRSKRHLIRQQSERKRLKLQSTRDKHNRSANCARDKDDEKRVAVIEQVKWPGNRIKRGLAIQGGRIVLGYIESSLFFWVKKKGICFFSCANF